MINQNFSFKTLTVLSMRNIYVTPVREIAQKWNFFTIFLNKYKIRLGHIERVDCVHWTRLEVSSGGEVINSNVVFVQKIREMVPLLRLTSKSFKNEFRVTYGLNYNLEIDLWCTTTDEVIGNRINLTAKLLIFISPIIPCAALKSHHVLKKAPASS